MKDKDWKDILWINGNWWLASFNLAMAAILFYFALTNAVSAGYLVVATINAVAGVLGLAVGLRARSNNHV